ncbi:MAG: hypothetical protein GXO47_06260 [Chlorobi bacterium]|nr:hypothetical protein [Chlorobiota bacterium]
MLKLFNNNKGVPVTGNYKEWCRSIYPAFVKTFAGLVKCIEMLFSRVHFLGLYSMAI